MPVLEQSEPEWVYKQKQFSLNHSDQHSDCLDQDRQVTSVYYSSNSVPRNDREAYHLSLSWAPMVKQSFITHRSACLNDAKCFS